MRRLPGACIIAAGLATAAACAQAADTGKALYQRCAVCHQLDGNGIPGVFPPLKNRLAAIVASEEGREYITMVLTEGLVANISVDGVSYVGAMPAQDLSDTEVARVVQYIATGFGRDPVKAEQLLSAAEVAAIRAKFAGDRAVPARELRTRVGVLDAR